MPTPEQRKKLRDALIEAFPERSLLEQLLDYELDKQLNQIAQDSNLKTIVYQLIQTAQAEGWLVDLIRAARKENPGNSELQAIAKEILPLEILSVSLPNISKTRHIPNCDALNQGNCDSDRTDIEGIKARSISGGHSSNSSLVEAVNRDWGLSKQLEECKHSHAIDTNFPVNNYISQHLKSEHKYPGLVFINVRLLNLNLEKEVQQFNLILDISFGEVEEKFRYKGQLGFVEREGYIRFGIKFGELCFKLTNGYMPSNLRKLPKIEQVFGLLSPTGIDECPTWQFKVDDKKNSTLFGSLTNQELGIIFLYKNSLVEAVFQINVNSNNLGVTAQEGVWNDATNKKVKETKLRAFFKKVVEPKIKDYASKVVLQYDSTSNS